MSTWEGFRLAFVAQRGGVAGSRLEVEMAIGGQDARSSAVARIRETSARGTGRGRMVLCSAVGSVFGLVICPSRGHPIDALRNE